MRTRVALYLAPAPRELVIGACVGASPAALDGFAELELDADGVHELATAAGCLSMARAAGGPAPAGRSVACRFPGREVFVLETTEYFVDGAPVGLHAFLAAAAARAGSN